MLAELPLSSFVALTASLRCTCAVCASKQQISPLQILPLALDFALSLMVNKYANISATYYCICVCFQRFFTSSALVEHTGRQKSTFDGKRMRKPVVRKTVDFNGSTIASIWVLCCLLALQCFAFCYLCVCVFTNKQTNNEKFCCKQINEQLNQQLKHLHTHCHRHACISEISATRAPCNPHLTTTSM